MKQANKHHPSKAFRLFHWGKVPHYFLQGLIVLAPITITVVALYWVFNKIDNILRPYLPMRGMGFVIILTCVVLIGWVSSFFLMGRLIDFFDRWLEKTPGIKFIYSSVRGFFEALAGNNKKFSKPVLVNVFAEEVWIVGFLTDEDLRIFNLGADYVSVYVPQAYNFAGQLYMVTRTRVRVIEQVPSGEAMKYAVTGGVIDMDEKPHNTTSS
jgi:uncharacterized membrane protein